MFDIEKGLDAEHPRDPAAAEPELTEVLRHFVALPRYSLGRTYASHRLS